jgi:hydroxymethylbilane synthase
MSTLRIGTRGSALALAQTRLVSRWLGERSPGLETEIVVVRVSGDAPPGEEDAHEAARGAIPEDKRRWVDAIEDALLTGEIDLAVHSAKDLPGELAAGLELLGAPVRAAPEDVLCVQGVSSARGVSVGGDEGRVNGGGTDDDNGGPTGLDGLAEGARVGTSSIRRAAQLRAARADLEVVAMGGNVDTRLRLLAQGAFDAIVLARAGLQRLGREDAIGAVLDPERFVPAPGQGALALEARAEDLHAREAVAAILDEDASACLLAERAVANALDASCHTPLGAHAAPAGCGCLGLRAWVGLPDGSAWVADELLGGFYDPGALGRRVTERMVLAGAEDLLRRAEETVTGAGHAPHSRS